MEKITFVIENPNILYDDFYNLIMYVDGIEVGKITYTEPMYLDEYNTEDDETFFNINRLTIYKEYRLLGYGNLLLQEFVNNVLKFMYSCTLEIGAFDVPNGEKNYYNNVVLPKFYSSYGFVPLSGESGYDENEYNENFYILKNYE